MHHEVHLRNIQLEANKYEKSAINVRNVLGILYFREWHTNFQTGDAFPFSDPIIVYSQHVSWNEVKPHCFHIYNPIRVLLFSD